MILHVLYCMLTDKPGEMYNILLRAGERHIVARCWHDEHGQPFQSYFYVTSVFSYVRKVRI